MLFICFCFTLIRSSIFIYFNVFSFLFFFNLFSCVYVILAFAITRYSCTISVLSTQTVTNSTAPPRPPPPEIPKSPPKWPLRPGVLVHVKIDTKQNLCASRTQSPNTSTLSAANVSYASPLLNANSRNASSAVGDGNTSVTRNPPPALPARQVGSTITANSNGSAATTANATEDKDPASEEFDVSAAGENNNNNNNVSSAGLIDAGPQNSSNASNNNDELITFTTSSLIERILGRLRWRRERSKPSVTGNGGPTNGTGHNSSGSQHSDESLFSKSNKRAVNLLRATGWFGSGKSTNSSTGLMFDKRHHLSGITCSDGGKFLLFYMTSCTE